MTGQAHKESLPRIKTTGRPNARRKTPWPMWEGEKNPPQKKEQNPQKHHRKRYRSCGPFACSQFGCHPPRPCAADDASQGEATFRAREDSVLYAVHRRAWESCFTRRGPLGMEMERWEIGEEVNELVASCCFYGFFDASGCFELQWFQMAQVTPSEGGLDGPRGKKIHLLECQCHRTKPPDPPDPPVNSIVPRRG